VPADVITIEGVEVQAIEEIEIEPGVGILGDEVANGEGKHLRLAGKIATKHACLIPLIGRRPTISSKLTEMKRIGIPEMSFP